MQMGGGTLTCRWGGGDTHADGDTHACRWGARSHADGGHIHTHADGGHAHMHMSYGHYSTHVFHLFGKWFLVETKMTLMYKFTGWPVYMLAGWIYLGALSFIYDLCQRIRVFGCSGID